MKITQLASLTKTQAESRFADGLITREEFDAFMHLWAVNGYRYGLRPMSHELAPSDTGTLAVVDSLRTVLANENTPSMNAAITSGKLSSHLDRSDSPNQNSVLAKH